MLSRRLSAEPWLALRRQRASQVPTDVRSCLVLCLPASAGTILHERRPSVPPPLCVTLPLAGEGGGRQRRAGGVGLLVCGGGGSGGRQRTLLPAPQRSPAAHDPQLFLQIAPAGLLSDGGVHARG